MNDTNHIQEMRDYLQRLLDEQSQKHYPDTLIIHPSDRRWFQTGQMRSSWQTKDIPVIESEHAQPGYATWIESTAFKPLEPLPPEFGQSDLMEHVRLRIASAFGLPYQYFPDQPYKWQRQDGETVTAWMIRLDKHELLDDPAIRWETQKATYASMWQAVKRIANIKLRIYVKSK